jgi:iron complex outermembrane recepter protein
MRVSNRVRILAGVSLASLMLSGSLANAQETIDEPTADEADQVLDSVVVTGFRDSLAEALDLKKQSTGVVDAIVAEDIAAFPDLNLAESLQRIPGIAIDRQAGEGRRITVRGLSGDFTRVRINGMDALATGGGSDASGGTNRSRSFDFNTFASELFSQLVVRKSQSASIEEGSLGAVVELQTARPLDYDAGWTFSASAQAMYNDLVEETSPRLAGLASYKNDNGTFGALLSAAFQDRTIREEGFSSVRFDDQGTFRSVNGEGCIGADPMPAACEEVRNSYYARIPRYGRLTYDQERTGLTGALQFRPTDRTTITVEGLYSELDAQRDEEFLQVFVRSNTDNIAITDYNVNSDGVLDYLQGDVLADTSNGIIPMRSEHRRDYYTTEFTQLTLEVEHDFSDTLRGSFFAGQSSSSFDNPVQATVFFDAANPVEGYSYDFRGDLEQPAISYGNTDVTDPSSFLFTQFRNRPQGSDNDFETVRADLQYDIDPSMTLSGGVSFKKYDFSTREIRVDGNVADLDGFTESPVVSGNLVGLVSGFGNGLDYSSNDTSWVSANWDAAIDLSGILDISGDIGSRPQDNRSVEEEDLGAYAQLDFETDLSGMVLRGDVGARYVETTTTASGYVPGDGGLALRTVENSYTDFLPSLNLVLEASDQVQFRAGVAKVMARPSLGSLTPGGSLDTFSGEPYTFSIGNPELDPYRATAFDLSAEWYFAEESLIAVSVFYKDVESYFLTPASTEVAFSTLGLPASVASSTSPLGEDLANGLDPIVAVSQVANGGEASIQGMEFVYQQPFFFLPGALSNAGFVGNLTYVDSDEIRDFSEISHNMTLYYETDRFSARISGAYRDPYQTRQPNGSGRTAGREERGVASTYNVDFSMSYALTEQLDVTFEGINLTDEFEHQTFDRLELPTLYHHTGRNFLLGARYTF